MEIPFYTYVYLLSSSLNYIVYVFILIYRFEYAYILILKYSRSYHMKIFQKKLYVCKKMRYIYTHQNS